MATENFNILKLSQEKHLTSFLKAVSWRVIGTLTTFFTTLSITQSLNISTSIGTIDLISKIVLFYLHERFWIRFGKKETLVINHNNI